MSTLYIRQRGVALVLVMWLVAALSLVVMGATQWIRSDNRLNRALVDQAQQRSLAKGVVFLLMRDIEAASRDVNYDPDKPFNAEFQLGDNLYQLQAIPAVGLINLNSAPEELLVLLFKHALSLDDQEAITMAQRFMDWREPKHPKTLDGFDLIDYKTEEISLRPRGSKFLVVEDMMQVMGISIMDYEKLRDLVTVLPNTFQGLRPDAAPPEVLEVLLADSFTLESSLELNQNRGQHSNHELLELMPTSSSSHIINRDFRVDVTVLSALGQERNFRFWVVHSPIRTQVTGVPWKVIH